MNIDTARIQHIQQQLGEIRQRKTEAFGAESHDFTLKPPVLPATLEMFEARQQVRLPAEYRAFLLAVGNGGAGQAYGLYSLEQSGTGGVLSRPSPLHPGMPQQGDWAEVLGLDEDSEAFYDGALTLLTQGCTYDVLLMVAGPYRGQIVYVDWNMEHAPYFSQFPDFLTWYETWLHETLNGYNMTGFGYGLPLTSEESVLVAADPREPTVRREAALNNLLRAPSLSADFLPALKADLMSEPNVALSTEFLLALARHGGDGLEEISWSILRKAQGSQIFRTVQAMQTLGMPDWTEAALWALEQDTDKDASESILFMLKREKAASPRAIELAFASQHAVTTGLYVNSELNEPLSVPDAFFSHPDPRVRRYSVEYQTREALQPKLSLLIKMYQQEESDHVRQGWALKLGSFDEPSVTAALIQLLQNERSPIAQSALINKLGERKVRYAVPLLIQLAGHEDGVLRLEAANALGEIGDERARPVLKALLSQKEHPFRFEEDGGGMGYAYSISQAARKALDALDG
ncbi:HEAT repeat domain-containing protein [Deinococcus sp. SM5_A1]|uniref:HEAT repeat domain-containing protein n=1 Tax=Deinococcus sp. SM5_A1 TaxID=3379094 RepID=UPI003859F092